MNLRVQLPVKASAKSLRTSFESIHRQWRNQTGTVRIGRITEDGWLDILVGPQLYPGEIGYSKPSTLKLLEKGDAFEISIISYTHIDLQKAFQLIMKKIDEYELQNRCLAEIILSCGENIRFKMIPSEWQPNHREIPATISSGVSFKQEVSSEEQKRPEEAAVPSSSSLPASPSLLIIDGMNIYSRCYWATAYNKEEKDLLKSSKGVFTNAIKPLAEKLVKVIRKYAPTHIVVAWESPGGRSTLFRRQLAESYKANRDDKEDPVSFKEQIETAKELFAAMNIKQYFLESHEADDIAGCLSKKWSTEINDRCYLWSNDKDYHQLLDPNVVQLVEDEPFDLEMFTQKYEGITPLQFIDYKGFCGDTSDNIFGVPGIGPKGAIGLLQAYGTMEKVFDAVESNSLDAKFKRYEKKLQEGSASGLLSRELATIKLDIPEMMQIPWEELLININRVGYLAKMEELEIEQKNSAA